MREIAGYIVAAAAIAAAGGSSLASGQGGGGFVDATEALGLGGVVSKAVRFADLDNDGWPDVVAHQASLTGAAPLVFLNRPAGGDGEDGAGPGRRFEPFGGHDLPPLFPWDIIVFADLNGDGRSDALINRYRINEKTDPPRRREWRTAWHAGVGDGRFGPEQPIYYATYTHTKSTALGDLNGDGLLDVGFGNWYTNPGASRVGARDDRLLQTFVNGERHFIGPPLAPPGGLNEDRDHAGRPTQAMLFVHLGEHRWHVPDVLSLNYGRRWNRLWSLSDEQEQRPARGEAQMRDDVAPRVGLDGDDVRHGRHPEWLSVLAEMDDRWDRPDEKPFRANGNTMDAAVGDVDNDGDFDLFFAELTHAWAGESSDRSRFLINRLKETGELRFESPAALNIDRTPAPAEDGDIRELDKLWAQSDLFCELADLDHDGRLDLILASGEYTDAPPLDERLRVFLQTESGTFRDATAELGLDHLGCWQISLADVDRDGDLDILAGQSFAQMSPEQRIQMGVVNGTAEVVPVDPATLDADAGALPEGAQPVEVLGTPRPLMRVFLNELPGERKSLVLKLVGDQQADPPVAREPLGAIVRITADLDGDPSTPPVTMSRQLIGVGGHAGKQSEFIVHAGLGAATKADRVEIVWPSIDAPVTVLEDVPAGRREVVYGEQGRGEQERGEQGSRGRE